MLTKAITALLKTAVKFSSSGETIKQSWKMAGEDIALTIKAKGLSLTDTQIAKLFDVFSIGEAIFENEDLGLELPLAERIIKLFEGSLQAERLEENGIKFTVLLKTE